MDAIQTTQYARALLDAHGPQAEAEAAQKARACEAAGKRSEAEDWTRIRRVINSLRGPRQK